MRNEEIERRFDAVVMLIDKTNENIQQIAEQLLIVATQVKNVTYRLQQVEEICQWTKTN